MKKCAYTLTLTNHKGEIVWQRTERKKKICFQFLDNLIDENLIQEPEPLMQVLIHLERRRDYGLSVLRAGIRREND